MPNLNRNLASLAAVLAPTSPPASPARLPAGRLTASVRRGLVALGWPTAQFNRRDLTAAQRWLQS